MSVQIFGIDWASRLHVSCHINETGARVGGLKFANDAKGFGELQKALEDAAKLGEVWIGIEKHDSPIHYFLRTLPYPLYEIPASRIAKRRSSENAARTKSDAKDAKVIANVVRTDSGELRPYKPEIIETAIVSQLSNERTRLVSEQTAAINLLRATLARANPVMNDLWKDLSRPAVLRFIKSFPSTNTTRNLTIEEIKAALKTAGYRNKRGTEKVIQALGTSVVGADPKLLDCMAGTVQRRVDRLLSLIDQIQAVEAELQKAIEAHPDNEVISSFPYFGDVLKASFIAGVGSDRSRFATAQPLTAFAGIAPVTAQSGRNRVAFARRQCNKDLKRFFIYHAFVSLRNPWARSIYDAAKKRGKHHYEALKILAMAWARVLFQCWKTKTPYDPKKHGGAERFSAAANAA